MDKQDNFVSRASDNAVENRVVARRSLRRYNVSTATTFLNRFCVKLDKPFTEAAIIGIIVENNSIFAWVFGFVNFFSQMNPASELIGYVVLMFTRKIKVLMRLPHTFYSRTDPAIWGFALPSGHGKKEQTDRRESRKPPTNTIGNGK